MSGIECLKRLDFPVSFPDQPLRLCGFHVSRDMAHDKLGLPNVTAWIDGFGNCDLWAYEYACGLQIVYEWCHAGGTGNVIADSPEIEHVLRHIPFDDSCIIRSDELYLSTELQRLLQYYPNRRTELESLHAFQVWRQDDTGNTFKVGDPTSERDAQCWVRHFESLGHKQMYWYGRI